MAIKENLKLESTLLSVFILLLSMPCRLASEGVQSVAAGRVLKIHERLSQSQIDLLVDSEIFSTDSNRIGLIYFSLNGQRYSSRLKNELKILLQDHTSRKNIWIWEIMFSPVGLDHSPSNSLGAEQYTRIVVSDHEFDSLFGIKAFPTLFVINAQFELTEYIAGFTATTWSQLIEIIRDSIAVNRVKRKSIDPTEKYNERLMRFAVKLYSTGNYGLVQTQLAKVSNVRLDAELLKVLCYYQQGAVEKGFQTLDSIPSIFEKETEYLYLRSVGKYMQREFNSASSILDLIEADSFDYRLPLLRSLIMEQLGQRMRARDELAQAEKLAGRGLNSSDLLEWMR